MLAIQSASRMLSGKFDEHLGITLIRIGYRSPIDHAGPDYL
jgi:hypothetical protein